jgi:hypothetical protein
MDSLKLNTYRLAAENGFWKLKRTAFQDWLGEIMTRRYPNDFQTIRLSQGDGGLDGYRLSTQTVYQVFAPRDYSPSEIINKIRGDFKHAQETLSENNLVMKEWVFVHNDPDGLTYDVVSELAKLRQDNPGIEVRTWGLIVIWNEIKQLAEDELVELFGAAPTLDMLENLCYKDIIPVIEHLASVKAPPLPPTDPPSPRKLEFNELSQLRAGFIVSGRINQGLVESYLDDMPDDDKPEEIAQAFRDKYVSLRDAGLDADQIFDELWLFAGSQAFASDPIKLAAVLTVLAFYFDNCDIFKNPPESFETT